MSYHLIFFTLTIISVLVISWLIERGTYRMGMESKMSLIPMPNEPISFEQIIELIKDHEIFYPTHGLNCWCMDRLIQELRRLINIPDVDATAGRQLDRINYVFRQVGRV